MNLSSGDIVAIVATIIAAFSALAAWLSASTARNLTIAQSEAEKRRLTLDAAKLIQEIKSKAESLNQQCDAVKLKYDNLAVFAGYSGGSWISF